MSGGYSYATNHGLCLDHSYNPTNEESPDNSWTNDTVVLDMDIIGFLPSSSELNASAFKRWNDDEESVRLGLSISHSVHGSLGGKNVEGRSDLTYVLQGSTKCDNLAGELETTLDASYVGTQSPDLIRALMEELRPRTSYSVASVSDGLFDLRGFAYVLGVAAAAGSNNAEFNYDRGLASVRLLSPSWSVPVAGQLTIGPGIAVSSREYVTLAYLAYAGGIRSLQLMADLLPDRTARPLQGTELAGFALKLANNVFCAAQSCACAGHHMQAFFRGMSYSWSLWGHTDEGGWIRKALSCAMYPPGAGIIAVTTEEFMSLPLRRRIASEDVTKLCVGLYLTFAGLVTVADCEKEGVPTVFEKDSPSDDARPSSFEGLNQRIYDVMGIWRRLVADRFELHHGAVGDEHSFASYFNADKVDRHLSYEALIPFWWVEPSPLVTGNTGKLFMPATRGCHKTIPFCGYEDLLHPDVPTHRNGTLAAGLAVKLKFGEGGLRSRGYSYLLSGSYRRENGLGYMEQLRDPDFGAYSTDAMFVEPGVTNCAERRWVTPHNPMPSPIEGYFVGTNMVQYVYAGNGNDPSLSDWRDGVVESMFGFFRVDSNPAKPTCMSHHAVPPNAKRLTRWLSQRVDDPVRMVSVNNNPLPTSRESALLTVVPHTSVTATVPLSDTGPPPPTQEEAITAPLDPSTGHKPVIKTDGGGETKDPGASA